MLAASTSNKRGQSFPVTNSRFLTESKCDTVRDAAAPGYVLALRGGQQIPQINPTNYTPGRRIDACNEIRLIHVCP